MVVKRFAPGRVTKIVAVNCLIFVVLLFLVLGTLETYLQLTIPASSDETIFEYTLDTPRYKVMKKNARIMAHGVELRTNAGGFRDHRPSFLPKTPGAFRVIILGDSFPVCAGVEYEQTWSQLLESDLQEVMPSAEVFNLAVGGYNVIRYRLTLEEVGLKLDPDLILVALYPENDFSNSTYDLNYRVAQGLEEKSAKAWHDRFYTYRVFIRPTAQRLQRLLSPPSTPKPKAEVDDEWDQNVAALNEIAGMAWERDILFQVVILPSNWLFSGQRELFSRVINILEDREIPYLALLDRFEQSGMRESELRLNAIDAHPNAHYNSMVAESIIPHFLETVAERR